MSSSLLAYFLKGGGEKKKDVVDAREASIARRTDARQTFCLVLSLAFASRGVSGASDGRVESDREETGDVKKLYRGEEERGEGAEGGGKLLRRAVRGRERERCAKHGKRGRV